MQSTALPDEMLGESDNQELTSSEVDPSNDLIIILQKISDREVRYKQKRQKLEQQKSVIKDMLSASRKFLAIQQGSIVVVQITDQALVHKQNHVPQAKLRTIVL